MRPSSRLPGIALVVFLVLVASSAPATASEPLWDANVTGLSLKVNGKGEALVTYRRSKGPVRHVLAWGAINAVPPSQTVPPTRFKWDYAGGWKKHGKAGYWKTFKNRCSRYDGPALAMDAYAFGSRDAVRLASAVATH